MSGSFSGVQLRAALNLSALLVLFSHWSRLYTNSFPTATLSISCLLRPIKLPNCQFGSWKEVLPRNGLTGIDLYQRLDSDMNAFKL